MQKSREDSGICIDFIKLLEAHVQAEHKISRRLREIIIEIFLHTRFVDISKSISVGLIQFVENIIHAKCNPQVFQSPDRCLITQSYIRRKEGINTFVAAGGIIQVLT